MLSRFRRAKGEGCIWLTFSLRGAKVCFPPKAGFPTV